MATLDQGAALDALEPRVIAELARREARFRRGEYWFCCPVHAERTPSAAYKPASRTWYCQGCGKGGGLFALADVLGVRGGASMGAAELERLRQDRAAIMAAHAEEKRRAAASLAEYWRSSSAAADLLAHSEVLRQLERDGIDRLAVDHFGVGWTVYGVAGRGVPAIAIPWTVAGETRAVQYRLLEDNDGGRYRWHPGSRPTLYNADAVLSPHDETLIIVEGAKKCMSLWGAGITSVCAIANKSAFNPLWARHLAGFRRVVFALDPDATAEAREAAAVVPRARVATMPLKPDDLLAASGGDVSLLMAYIDNARAVR